MTLEEFKSRFEKTPIHEFNANTIRVKPKVSICVQTYNQEQFIAQCLDSLLAQETDFDYEILLGEDQSTDNTRAICKQYAEQFPNKIRLFLHERANNITIDGVPTGRFNFLNNLFHARGKYIAFCEGDDYWIDKNKLQIQYNEMEANQDLSICYTLAEKSDGSDMQEMYASRMTKPISFPFKYDFTHSIQSKGGPTLTMFFRRSQLNLNSISDSIFKTIMADWPIELMIMQNGMGICLPQKTAMYRINPNGMTQTALTTSLYFKSRNMVCLELLSKETNETNKQTIRKFLFRLYLQWSLFHFGRKEFNESWKKLKLANGYSRYFFQKGPKINWIKMFSMKSIILHFGKLTFLHLVPTSYQAKLPKRLQH